MKRTLLALALLTTAACVQPPTAPDAVCTTDSDCAAWEERQNIPERYRSYGAPEPAARVIMQTHNIPAIDTDGSRRWVCATQPRRYSTGWEVDHYIADNPCPARPID
jgi:hypothetical protein